MKSGAPKIFILIVILIGVVAGLGWLIFGQYQDREGSGKRGKASRPVPVEVARVQRGPIELRRTFSGELEALAEFVVAPKVSGRVERVIVNIGDTVNRGQVVAELDNDEYVQAVTQARADLAVAQRAVALERTSGPQPADSALADFSWNEPGAGVRTGHSTFDNYRRGCRTAALA